MKKKKKKKSSFDIVGAIIIYFVALISIIPFILLVSGSFTSESEVVINGFSIIPKKFSLDAYKYIFKSPEKILRGFWMSIATTGVGTLVSVFITAMTGYVLSRKKFLLADKIAFFLYFTTLFSGGLLPYYILMVRYLHLKNTFLALIIPGMLPVFNILIMRNFAKEIPYEISESAYVDGAGEFQIFMKLYLPMMKPSLATIGLLVALSYWGNWSNSMLYTDQERLYTLQYLLYRATSGLTAIAQNPDLANEAVITLPTQTVKLAMTVITVIPVAFVYPFAQKYLVQGMTVGAVKG